MERQKEEINKMKKWKKKKKEEEKVVEIELEEEKKEEEEKQGNFLRSTSKTQQSLSETV